MKMLKKLTRPLTLIAALALSAALLSACASEEHTLHAVEGEAIELGDLAYNVIFTRPLNIYDVEDKEYLVGKEPPSPGQMYLGVFVQIENTSDENSQRIPEDIVVTDTDEQVFEAIESESIYALNRGNLVGPGDVVPALDSTAQVGPIEGSALVFELPDEATENRPLELVIPGPDGDLRVELDI